MPIGQYIISKTSTDLTRAEAAQLAASLGGKLASVTSSAEDALIRAILAKDTLLWNPEPRDNARNGPWIGLTQPPGSPEPGGGWKWDSGEAFSYSNWHAGQPDNYVSDNTALYWDWNGAIGWADHINDPVSQHYGAVKSAAIEFAASKVTLNGTGGHDFIYGGKVNNVLNGGGGNDWIEGNGGADRIAGNLGNDKLRGGAGGDKLIGGAGRDTLSGGNDTVRDTFDFNALTDTGKTATTRDIITDFHHGTDKIDLHDIDAVASSANNQDFTFVTGPLVAAGQVHVVKIDLIGTANDRTIVEGDVTGDGKADFQIELVGLIALTKGDFIL